MTILYEDMYNHVSSSNQTTSMCKAVSFPVHMVVFDLLKNGHEGSLSAGPSNEESAEECFEE